MKYIQYTVASFIICLLASIHAPVQAQNQSKDMEKIQTLIRTIAKAADNREAATLEKHLHPEFRVVVNRFGGEDTKVLAKKVYLDLLKAGKIGGDQRTVTIGQIEVKDHIAVAKATLTGSKSVFTSFYQFVKNKQEEWVLINDMPLINAKK